MAAQRMGGSFNAGADGRLHAPQDGYHHPDDPMPLDKRHLVRQKG